MNPRGANRHNAEESPGAGGVFLIFNALWRPAGLVYLVVMLLGLGAGLWPGIITGAGNPYSRSPNPIVQTLVVANVMFYLLVYPLIVLFRASKNPRMRFWPDTLVETLFWMFVSAAFFVPGVWLSGSVPYDAVRGMGYVCGLLPMAWICGSWLGSRRSGRAVVLFVSVFSVIALPWLWYVSIEFFSVTGWHEALWNLCPVTHAWSLASPHAGEVGASPLPFWALIVWPIVAVVMLALSLIVPKKNSGVY
jgi:hypothetical protein